MLKATSILVAARDQVSCDLGGGETTILHLGSGTYYGLASVGARIWEWLQEARTFAELEKLILAEFDVAADRAQRDLGEFYEQLASAGLVERQ